MAKPFHNRLAFLGEEILSEEDDPQNIWYAKRQLLECFFSVFWLAHNIMNKKLESEQFAQGEAKFPFSPEFRSLLDDDRQAAWKRLNRIAQQERGFGFEIRSLSKAYLAESNRAINLVKALVKFEVLPRTKLSKITSKKHLRNLRDIIAHEDEYMTGHPGCRIKNDKDLPLGALWGLESLWRRLPQSPYASGEWTFVGAEGPPILSDSALELVLVYRNIRSHLDRVDPYVDVIDQYADLVEAQNSPA